MFSRIIIVALALLFSSLAQAQVTATITPQPPVCTGQSALGWTGSAYVCNPFPTSTGNVTITNGPGISVTGGPAYVVAVNFPVVTKTGSYPLTAADVSRTLVLNSAQPGTFTLLQAGLASTPNGTVVCFVSRGTGSLTLATTGSVFYGGPTVLNKGQSECAQADDAGNWLLHTGVSPVIPNPNTFN